MGVSENGVFRHHNGARLGFIQSGDTQPIEHDLAVCEKMCVAQNWNVSTYMYVHSIIYTMMMIAGFKGSVFSNTPINIDWHNFEWVPAEFNLLQKKCIITSQKLVLQGNSDGQSY